MGLEKGFDLTTLKDNGHELVGPKQFIVRRNQSLSWQGNKRFILYIAILSLGIATIFALQGMWLILPFAGLEILILAGALYFCCLRNRHQEVITIDDKSLIVEKGVEHPSEVWKFDRAWVNLELKRSQYIGHPSKLIIHSKGKQVEVGEHLTNQERKALASSLVKTLNTLLMKS